METVTPIVNNEKQFVDLKISKLEEALSAVRTKIQLHSSYANIRHLMDKEKELADMLDTTRKQYIW